MLLSAEEDELSPADFDLTMAQGTIKEEISPLKITPVSLAVPVNT